MMRSAAFVVLLVIATSTSVALAAEIDDRDLSFRLTLPEGFRPFPEGKSFSPDTVYSYILGDPRDNVLDIVVLIERMHGVLGRERLAKKARELGVELIKEPWGPFTLEVFRIPETLEGVSLLTFNAQVPLRHEAIQLKLTGPAAREQEMRSLLKDLLANLEGDTNWLTDSERVSRLFTGLAKLGGTILVVYVIVRFFRRR